MMTEACIGINLQAQRDFRRKMAQSQVPGIRCLRATPGQATVFKAARGFFRTGSVDHIFRTPSLTGQLHVDRMYLPGIFRRIGTGLPVAARNSAQFRKRHLCDLRNFFFRSWVPSSSDYKNEGTNPCLLLGSRREPHLHLRSAVVSQPVATQPVNRRCTAARPVPAPRLFSTPTSSPVQLLVRRPISSIARKTPASADTSRLTLAAHKSYVSNAAIGPMPGCGFFVFGSFMTKDAQCSRKS